MFLDVTAIPAANSPKPKVASNALYGRSDKREDTPQRSQREALQRHRRRPGDTLRGSNSSSVFPCALCG
jgi:hypothetical protein